MSVQDLSRQIGRFKGVRIDYANAGRFDDLGTVYINGQAFKGIGYQGLLTVNTKTYVAEPTRSNDGSIANINDYETFVVPRCKLNFKYMNLADYMRLCEAVQSNEFIVDYYDKQFNKRVQHLMYCEPEEMTKLYNVGTWALGVLDYEISFIGTLNETVEYSVRYDANGGSVKGLVGDYSSVATYSKGQRVRWVADSNYYEAIYEEKSFKGKELSETGYWLAVTPTEWSENTQYVKGNLVYVVSQNADGQTVYKYYEAIYESFNGFGVTNATYWKSVSVADYSAEKTYTLGDYAIGVNGSTPSESTYYKAIYYSDTFSGQSPEKTAYWKLLPILSPIKLKWGQSMVLASITDLFEPPSVPINTTSKDKWLINSQNTNNYYLPNQSINVYTDLVLYAKWGQPE